MSKLRTFVAGTVVFMLPAVAAIRGKLLSPKIPDINHPDTAPISETRPSLSSEQIEEAVVSPAVSPAVQSAHNSWKSLRTIWTDYCAKKLARAAYGHETPEAHTLRRVFAAIHNGNDEEVSHLLWGQEGLLVQDVQLAMKMGVIERRQDTQGRRFQKTAEHEENLLRERVLGA